MFSILTKAFSIFVLPPPSTRLRRQTTMKNRFSYIHSSVRPTAFEQELNCLPAVIVLVLGFHMDLPLHYCIQVRHNRAAKFSSHGSHSSWCASGAYSSGGEPEEVIPKVSATNPRFLLIGTDLPLVDFGLRGYKKVIFMKKSVIFGKNRWYGTTSRRNFSKKKFYTPSPVTKLWIHHCELPKKLNEPGLRNSNGTSILCNTRRKCICGREGGTSSILVSE